MDTQSTAHAAFRIAWRPTRAQLASLTKRIGGKALDVGVDVGTEILLNILTDDQEKAADEAIGKAVRAGFTQTQTIVYTSNNTVYLLLTDPSTDDAQVPFIMPRDGALCPYCFLGGPAIAIMNQGARDLGIMNPHLTSQQLGSFFLPAESRQQGPAWLTYSRAWSMKYWTRVGWVQMSYRPLRAPTATMYGVGDARIDVYQRSQRGSGWVNVLGAGYELDTV